MQESIATHPTLHLMVPPRYEEQVDLDEVKPVLICILAFPLGFPLITLEHSTFMKITVENQASEALNMLLCCLVVRGGKRRNDRPTYSLRSCAWWWTW